MPIFRTKQKSITDIEKAASSKAINKTIREIDALLEGKPLFSKSPLRTELHDKIYELLKTEVKNWYRRGFKRGHETILREFKKAPKTITRKMRMYSVYFGPDGESIKLKSKIKA